MKINDRMDSPLKTYKILKDVHDIKNIAYYTLFTKYIIKNDHGDKKLTEIDSTDQETLISHLNGGYPIPGLMYTFIYKPEEAETVLIKSGKDVKKYIDKVPIVFCVNTSKGKFSGINMNTLPNLERVKFLEMFYSEYKDFFEDVEKLTQNKMLAINKKYLESAKSDKGQNIIKGFNIKSGANFNYGYRNYDMKKVARLRMIEYSEWDYLPHYNPRDAFKIMNFGQIHNMYWRNK
jgi:hypothetical protein